MKLDGVNARVIPLRIGEKAIKYWQKSEFNIDYSRRPRICPKNFISKCFKSPYIEIKGRPARKCLTLCKGGKPCFIPCICECKPKSKVKFSKAMIPHLVIPVDKRQLIPSCNRLEFVRCTAQIYGESTNRLCAFGCGEGVCPLTCNCQCVADLITRRGSVNRIPSNNELIIGPNLNRGALNRISSNNELFIGPNLNRGALSRIPSNNELIIGPNLNRGALNRIPSNNELFIGPNLNIQQNIDSVGGGGGVRGGMFGINTINGGLRDSGLTLDNGIFLEGPEIVNIRNILENRANSNIFDGRRMAAAGTRSGAGLLFNEGGNVIGSVQNNINGGAGLVIDNRENGAILTNELPNIGMSGPPDLTTDLVGENIQLISPVDGTLASPTNFGPSPISSGPVAPLQGVETETVQVQIDVQSPEGHGNIGSGGPGSGTVGLAGPNAGSVGHEGHGFDHGGPLAFGNTATGNGFFSHGFSNGGTENGLGFGGNTEAGGIPVDISQHSSIGLDTPILAALGFDNSVRSNTANRGGPSKSEIGFGRNINAESGSAGGSGSPAIPHGPTKGADNFKLRIPGPNGKKGGAINLDLSGILSTIPGMGAGEGNGPNEMEFLNQLGGNVGSGGFFQNEQMMGGLSNLFGGNAEQASGKGGLGILGGSTLDLFGGSTGRSETSSLGGLAGLGGLGTEMSFDALSMGSSSPAVATSGGNSVSNSNNMGSFLSLLNTGGGRAEPEDRCLKGTILSCNVTPEWSHVPSLVKWCNDTCPKGGCNKERCKCTCITQDEFLLPTIG